MEAVRSGGDLENLGGDGEICQADRFCPDGCVIFRLTAEKLGGENFFKGKFFDGGARDGLTFRERRSGPCR